MRTAIAFAALTATVAIPTTMAPVVAQYYDRGGDYGRPVYRGDYDRPVYRGAGYDYRYRCKRSSGTTGLVLGGVGGGVLGSVLGGGTLGTILGAGGGALLGRHLDQKNDNAQNRRNGC